MKLIFLDVDGVLNSENYIVSEFERLGHDKYVETYLKQGGIPFDPECLRMLRYILDVTGALICVSSTWRLCKDQRERLNTALGKYSSRIIGYTKSLNGIRGIEIERFLEDLKEIKAPIEKYIIIDDDNDMLESQKENLVITDFKTGLNVETAMKSVRILNY